MKQFDIHYWFNLIYFQSLIQLNLIFRNFQNKWVLSCSTFNNWSRSKFDSFCVDHSVQLPINSTSIDAKISFWHDYLTWPLVASWSISKTYCSWTSSSYGSWSNDVKSLNNYPWHTTLFHELATLVGPLKVSYFQKLLNAHLAWGHCQWWSPSH